MVQILHCKRLDISKQLPTFHHRVRSGFVMLTSEVGSKCVLPSIALSILAFGQTNPYLNMESGITLIPPKTPITFL